MTPSEVETAARNRYNASSDTFFSQAEIFELIYQAETELATKANVIEALDTSTSTVSGTQAYAFPTAFTAVKRVTWNGKWLKKIEFREDDVVTAQSSNTTVTGEPSYYWIWNNSIYLREIPNAAQTLGVHGYKLPTALSVSPLSSSLSVPTRYHTKLINYVVAHMCSKDKDWNGFQTFITIWRDDVEEAKRYEARRKRTDSFSYVKNEDQILTTDFGP